MFGGAWALKLSLFFSIYLVLGVGPRPRGKASFSIGNEEMSLRTFLNFEGSELIPKTCWVLHCASTYSLRSGDLQKHGFHPT